MSRPTIAIVDVPGSRHAGMMEMWAQIGRFKPDIRWVEPTLSLPADLDGLDGVVAAALPVSVRGGNPTDQFTRRLQESIAGMVARGIPAFVASGNRRPNDLASVGIRVAPRGSTNGATLRVGPPAIGSSGACVRAASLHALLHEKKVRFKNIKTREG